MKRIAVIIVCALFLVSVAGSSLAVEKKDKDKKVVVKPKPSVTKKTSKAAKNDSAKAVKVKPQKKYDKFVDANKNGIDDRKEKLVPKAMVSKKAVTKKTVTKKAVTKKTPKKTSDKK